MSSLSNKINVAIVGAAGYAGAELLRLLLQHPDVLVQKVFSDTYVGKSVSAALPGASLCQLKFETFSGVISCQHCDLIFLAQGHGKAMALVDSLLSNGKKVIDISADYRLKNINSFREWYKHEHSDQKNLEHAVYGLPEINREEIRNAKLIANPGCYPTASILALLPIVKLGLIDFGSIVIDAKSGVSGAGRANHSLEYHFPELNENVKAYGLGGVHRHTPEIEQALIGAARGVDLKVSFTPHLIPISRGLLATCSASLKSTDIEVSRLHSEFKNFYKDHPFVIILDPGNFPMTKSCCGTNLCQIGIAVDKRTNRVTVVSAIDNLIKGAAGQAIQNMNLMCGFDETKGLNMIGVWP